MNDPQPGSVQYDRTVGMVGTQEIFMTDQYSPVNAFAERMSANCFFNALLRETGCGTWHMQEGEQLPDGIGLPAVSIPLPASSAELWLNISYHSECGRHQFALPMVWRANDGSSKVIEMAEAAELVAQDFSFFPGATVESRTQFTRRVASSVKNMTQALVARSADTEKLFSLPLSFAEAEQALLCGHSIHPTPKSRDPFTDKDAECYAPEFNNRFALVWLGVDPQFLQGASGAEISEVQFADLVRGVDGGPVAPEGFVAFPAHPWQWRKLCEVQSVVELLEAGKIVELGEGSESWRATSSLRAIYSGNSPYMLKFSLSLRLTNSVRTLQPKEMVRGLEVLKVRGTPVGQEFANRYPRFQVLAEPAYLMLADIDGKQIIESLVMFRENPFLGESAENTCLLATLTQDHPDGSPCRAAQLVQCLADEESISIEAATKRWFNAFLDAVIEPLLIAQADFGILFGAHQQNLILSFEGPLPVAGYFRDCQGSGYSRLGEQLLKPYLPNLAQGSENVIDEQMANRLFVYYLIVNSCFGLICALSAAGLITERELLRQLRQRLLLLHEGQRRDSSCLEYLLNSPEIWAKGNFQCAVIGMNETTTEDPLSIYHKMANPLISAVELTAEEA
ncbi:IucA/IucC family protein [Microbulbifer sp. SSSA007]|uniref:IucA/IucC family protein n=2 Tax=Microbulbiferaceae TaxID=1706373 RepID=UPI00035D6189|nr:IucA/IucC family protein [Microbulbifer variabilis]